LIQCPFEATAYFWKKGVNRWNFTVRKPQHNHEPSDHVAAHTTNRKLSKSLYEEMKALGEAGLKPSEILLALKKTHPNEAILATISTIYTARKKAQQEMLQGISPIVHLNKTLMNTNFTTATKVDSEGTLKGLFFCHARSVNLLKAYPHIILLDCTYKTNKYRMPLLHISGITGSNKTFSVAFCFMAEETEPFYDWALQSLLTVFDSHHISHPAVVITDREQALINSLSKSFPQAHRLLCVWHIQKNLVTKAAKLISQDDQRKDMLQYWMNIVKITTQSDFYSSFARWSNKYGPEWEKYVTSTWLPVAEHYANAWTCSIPHFNNRTTSRMESAHAFVKSHLLGPQQTFTSVIQLISNAIEKQYHEITTKHAQQKITTLRYLGNFFRLCLGKITNYAIRQAYNSLEKAKSEVPLSRCNQRYVARMGIPCKHRLLSLFQSGELVSPDEFHAQWQMSVSLFQLPS
jgi:hypothetical protein